MSHRDLGTGSGHAASGNHNHAGQYASTVHAAAHRADGADPITELGGFELYQDDGNGRIAFQAQTNGTPTAWPEDDHIQMFAQWLGFRPVMSVQSIDRIMPFGDEIAGPGNIWRAHANTGSTAPPVTEVPHTTTGTWSAPSPTAALGFRQTATSGTTAGNVAQIGSTDTRWCRGDGVLPWHGYYFHYRGSFESAAYTSSRIFIGMTDQSATTATGADNPAGHRHGFRVLNGSGNWNMTTKNGTTEALLDTGIAFAANAVFDFFVYMRPNGGYAFGQVRNLTAATDSGSLIDIAGSASAPGTTTFMRAMAVVGTTNTTAKSLTFHRIGCEVAA